MRIGFDAKWYFDGPVSGRVAVRNLLEGLATDAGGHDVIAITDHRSADRALSPVASRIERAGVWGGNNLVANAILLARAARKARCDVLVAQNFAPLSTSIPTVAFVYDLLFRDYPQFYTWKERAYFSPLALLGSRATRICTISESERHRIARAGIASPDRIDVVPMGVDQRFQALADHDPRLITELRARLALPPEFLLYVGRLNARKNVSGLLRALPQMRNQSIPLVVAGGRDWKSEDPQGIAAALGLTNRVIFLGPVQDSDLPGLFALATAFVFPSWAEGFGLPPLEAMSAGVPCAVAESTSLPEVCGDAAVYFNPASPHSMAAAIDSILEDKALRSRFVIRGRARAAAYSWRRATDCLINSVELAARGARR